VEADPYPAVSAALVAGLLAGYGIAVPVGAVGTYLVSLTARTSLRVGACAALGIATADGVYALVAQLGGAALAHAIRPALTPLRLASAAVLVALAARAALSALAQYRGRRQPAKPTEGTPVSPVRAYLGLWTITMLNPVTIIYFAAIVLGSQHGTAPSHLDQVTFVCAAFAASASWQLLLALGGALLGRVLVGYRGRIITAAGSSILIMLLALRLIAR
jgi:threonine/homoserine/homoserine lactone efflux protein